MHLLTLHSSSSSSSSRLHLHFFVSSSFSSFATPLPAAIAIAMAVHALGHPLFIFFQLLPPPLGLAAHLFYSFNVSYLSLNPLGVQQQVIGINGMFPGPQINATTNDIVTITVYNNLDEEFLLTWDGIEQRKTSWQDGVSGTNCAIPPSSNWTYTFQVKDQIGSFFYFPTTMFQKAAGGFGSIRINSPANVPPSFSPSEDDFVLLVGDWYTSSHKDLRNLVDYGRTPLGIPSGILINGKGPYNNKNGVPHDVFTVKAGYTYRFRISNVGIATSLNFRIQNHTLHLVETEGSYVQQQEYDSLDIHVGQSYSFLLTANQVVNDYYIVASPRVVNISTYGEVLGVAILHYSDSKTYARGPLPPDPGVNDNSFSINQAQSIRWNLSAPAARAIPQGSFQQGKISINDTFWLQGSSTVINQKRRFAVNGRSYQPTVTPLQLADYLNITDVFQLGIFPKQPVDTLSVLQTSVVSGKYRGFTEFVFINNDTDGLQSWHIDGYSCFVVGMGALPWTEASRKTYNRWDAVSRMTFQVYPGSWTTVLTELDNVGMWNIRSEMLESWYLGQELYMRVYDPEVSMTKIERPPSNLLLCGQAQTGHPPTSSSGTTNKNQTSSASHQHIIFHVQVGFTILILILMNN